MGVEVSAEELEFHHESHRDSEGEWHYVTVSIGGKRVGGFGPISKQIAETICRNQVRRLQIGTFSVSEYPGGGLWIENEDGEGLGANGETIADLDRVLGEWFRRHH